ncbi:MAG: DUF6122 family protein [Gammaproteobacteria bacterium]|nr:DUF6122 family protein [Gammaproteobacteria bacterium]
MLHIAIHLLVPALVAIWVFPESKYRVFLILASTLLVDLDHLLASPIYDPSRCSIGFHPLHGYIAIGCYGLMLLHKKSRLIGLGLMIHMLLDTSDCIVMDNLPLALMP